MTIKDDLTAKDVMDRFERIFEKMDTRYDKLVGDVNLALNKLNETTEELRKARELREGGFTGVIIKSANKHPKITICTAMLLITIAISGIICFSKDRDFWLKFKDWEFGAKTSTENTENK